MASVSTSGLDFTIGDRVVLSSVKRTEFRGLKGTVEGVNLAQNGVRVQLDTKPGFYEAAPENLAQLNEPPAAGFVQWHGATIAQRARLCEQAHSHKSTAKLDWKEIPEGIKTKILSILDVDFSTAAPASLKRKFVRTTVTVEVLSKGPIEFEVLEDLHGLITHGDCSGSWKQESEVLTRQDMAKALVAQGSEPEFLLGDEMMCPVCESKDAAFTEMPDTGTSCEFYEVKCPDCGAHGAVSHENQDGSTSFESYGG